jgi:hypothetical protein
MNRIASALRSIASTFVSVLTLPFRVLGKLFGGGRKRPATR